MDSCDWSSGYNKDEHMKEISAEVLKLRAEVKSLKSLLTVEPNVCSKCGAFLGLLAETECLNCDKLCKLVKLYDDLYAQNKVQRDALEKQLSNFIYWKCERPSEWIIGEWISDVEKALKEV